MVEILFPPSLVLPKAALGDEKKTGVMQGSCPHLDDDKWDDNIYIDMANRARVLWVCATTPTISTVPTSS